MGYRDDPEVRRVARAAYYQANKEKCNEASRAWALKNPSRRREIERKYDEAHREQTKIRARLWNAQNKERNRQKRIREEAENPERFLLKSAKSRAKKRGVELTITVHDISIPQSCPIRGVTLKRGTQGNCPDAPSLDRIDPNKGYIPGNVWVISNRANVIKNDGTPEEHEQIAAAVRKKLGQG